MPLAHGERVGIRVKKLPVKSLEGVTDADHHVDGTREFGGEDRGATPWHHVDPHTGRQCVQLFHQRRHQKFDGEVWHHQPEAALAARRIELIRHKQPTHLIQRLRQRRAQRLCARRQLHACAGAH